ncbi:MAG: response regulator, partial [bacterium]
VDDEREILLLLEQILTGEGFQVLTASDGQEGLEIYLRERPPLVVSDAMLPRLHGFELCRRIKEESRQAAKIMILTAVYKKYKYKGKVQEEYGVDEYLDKPFQITEFLQTFYRMAETMSPERLEAPLEGRLTVGEPSETLSFILASAEDRDLASKVTAYCERHKYRHLRIEDPRKLIDTLRHQGPDILLLGESLPGLDTGLAAYIIRDLLEARWTTTVLVTRDRSRMEKHMDGVDHKVAAPIDNSVLDNIVSLHLSARGPEDQRRQQTRSLEDRRVDALLRSKVDRILKSHNQLEEYYSTRVRETEAEIQRQRTAREEEAGRMRDEFNEETGRLRQELEERSALISELEKEIRHLRDLLSQGGDVGE